MKKIANMKKIAVLTSGGDAPGMNAAVRGVVRHAIENEIEVIGIKRGYKGLLEEDFIAMDRKSVSGIIQHGGTVLRSARCKEFATAEGEAKAAAILKKHGIEGLVTIGGDGTFRGAKALAEKHEILTIGIPGTIDNDLSYTDYTLGFDTACNTALFCMNNLRDTMNSHERVSVVEVMGRRCGDIAIYSGISSGAEIIIVPEEPIEMEEIVQRLNDSRRRGKKSNIVVLAEGAGKCEDYATAIAEASGYDVRGTSLGHILRGGSPTMQDRMLGSQFGHRAIELMSHGIGNRVIGIKNNIIIDYDIFEALSMPKRFHKSLYEASKVLSM